MNTEPLQITVGGMPVEVVRKQIKNLHLGVYPPNGRVRVAAPASVSDEAVRLAVVSRMGWIKRQQAKFQSQPRQTERAYVSGETHYFFGQRYRLSVIQNAPAGRVHIKNSRTLELFVRPGSDKASRERVLQGWYRSELRARALPLIAVWAEAFGIDVPQWGIKKMKTKWGSCNIEGRRVWLNLELVKKHPHCLEYVIVHELVHFFERNHTDRFVAILEQKLPNWRMLRDELNAAPLAHEEWASVL